MTYECKVCWGINSANKLHCSTCGTIPAVYSWNGKTIRERADTISSFNPETISNTIDVVVALNAERQTTRRTIKRTARTVPMDYYASE